MEKHILHNIGHNIGHNIEQNVINELFDNIKQINDNEWINTYNEMNIDDIMNIISDKINNIKIINDELIKKLCIGIITHCKKHNSNINGWYDKQYYDNLKTLKQNNDNFLKLSIEYETKSIVMIDNYD